jgi:hypothetical protein
MIRAIAAFLLSSAALMGQTLGLAPNSIRTVLTANVGISDTTISVAVCSKIAPGVTVNIDSEIMYASAVSATTCVLTVTRAYSGTAAARHYTGAVVSAYLTGLTIDAASLGLIPDARDNGPALQAAINTFQGTGACVLFPATINSTYLVRQSLVATLPFCWEAPAGSNVRIKYAGVGAITNMVALDCSGTGASFCHGGMLNNLVLDGGQNGAVQYGLQLKSVVNATVNVRATNFVSGGVRCGPGGFCQQINFNVTVSSNVEAYTTTSVDGLIFEDGFSHSANTIILNADHLLGSGLRAKGGLINTNQALIVSEGNARYGVEMNCPASNPNINNHFIGAGDYEVNTLGDFLSDGCVGSVSAVTTATNTYTALNGSSPAGATFIRSTDNVIIGGSQGAISFDATSTNNVVIGTHFYGAGGAVSGAGICETILNVRNETSGVYSPSKLCGMTGGFKVHGPGTAYHSWTLLDGSGSQSKYFYTASLGVNLGVDTTLGQHIVYNVTAPFTIYSASATDPVSGAVVGFRLAQSGSTQQGCVGNFCSGNIGTWYVYNGQTGQATTNIIRLGQTQGAVHPWSIVDNATGATELIGADIDGGIIQGGVAFAALGTPASGKLIYCNNCTIASPCASGGTGAFAKRLNSIWACN